MIEEFKPELEKEKKNRIEIMKKSKIRHAI